MDENRSMLKALALATQLGFALAGPLVVFIGGGVWLDGVLGTRPWLFFLGLVLGIGSAGAALYQIATAQPAPKPGKTARKAPDKVEPLGGDGPPNDRRWTTDDDENTDD